MRVIRAPKEPTASVGMGTMLTRQAERDPDRPAVTIAGRTTLRGELERGANRRARAFLAAGVRRDDLVAISLSSGPEFHETAFAAWKIGATPASISYRLSTIEVNAILALMNPRLAAGVAADPARNFVTLAADWQPDTSIADTALPECIGTYAKAMTSGGSTGRPKIIVQHARPTVDPQSPLLGLALDDTVLMPAPLYHNAPFNLTHLALCWGAHVIEMEKFDPLETLRLIERHRVKWLYLVPTMMHRIWSLPEPVRKSFDVSSLEMVLHMAAPCAPWLKQAWLDWLGPARLWEMYGATEGIGATALSGDEWLLHKGSVGRCYMGSLRILDEDHRDCSPGQIGEIYFMPAGGPGSTYHYLGDVAKAHNGWETVGDLGWLDSDGYLYLADRRTDMIITGGTNIYPAEIEAALDEHPMIGSSACIGLSDADLGERLHAIIETRAGCDAPAPEELESFLAARIAHYKIPYTYEISAEPLRDDAGKIRRSALRAQRRSQQDLGVQFERLRSNGMQ